MIHQTERTGALQLGGFGSDRALGQRVLTERPQSHEVVVTGRAEVGSAETEVDSNRATIPGEMKSTQQPGEIKNT